MPHPGFYLSDWPEGKGEVFTFWKGRVALFAILKALEVGSGDRVLMPGYTCMVVPSAVMFAGAQPVYADVEAESYNVTLRTLEAALRNSPYPRPKAVIIQHTYGIPVEAGPIIEWARDEGIAVIEDCAHVLGSTYHGSPCGSLGDAAFFSSQWNKPVTTGLGGWAVTNSRELAERLRGVRAHFQPPPLPEVAQVSLQYWVHRLLFRPRFFWPMMTLYRSLGQHRLVIGSSSSEELDLKVPWRYAMRMSTFQERLLKKALTKAAAVIAHRQRLAAFYERELAEGEFELPRVPPSSQAVFLRYPVKVKNKAQKLSLAQKNRIELGDWFVSPLHPLMAGWEKLGYRPGSCPVGEELSRTVVNLPTHPRVRLLEARKIVDFIIT